MSVVRVGAVQPGTATLLPEWAAFSFFVNLSPRGGQAPSCIEIEQALERHLDPKVGNVTAQQNCEPCARFGLYHPQHPQNGVDPDLCRRNLELHVESMQKRLLELTTPFPKNQQHKPGCGFFGKPHIGDCPVHPPKTGDPVNHPSHYKSGGLESIDVIEAFDLPFDLGNTVKYVLRAGRKETDKTVQDLNKADWRLQKPTLDGFPMSFDDWRIAQAEKLRGK